MTDWPNFWEATTEPEPITDIEELFDAVKNADPSHIPLEVVSRAEYNRRLAEYERRSR